MIASSNKKPEYEDAFAHLPDKQRKLNELSNRVRYNSLLSLKPLQGPN